MKNLIILNILPDLSSRNFLISTCLLLIVILLIFEIRKYLQNSKDFKESQLNSFNFQKKEVGLVFEIMDFKNNLILFKKYKLNQFDKLIYMGNVYIDKEFCLSQYFSQESMQPGNFFMLFVTSIQSNTFILKPGIYEHNRFITQQLFVNYQNRS